MKKQTSVDWLAEQLTVEGLAFVGGFPALKLNSSNKLNLSKNDCRKHQSPQ